MKRVCLMCISLFVFALGCSSKGTGQTSKNMKLVGTNDLQARSSYEVQVYKQGSKYIAYVGHHTWSGPSQYSSGAGEGLAPLSAPTLPKRNPLTGQDEDNGTSIVDVTDPAHPVYLAHIPVCDNAGGGAQMVRVCGNLPNAPAGNFYMLRSYHSSAHEIWNVTDPSNPQPALAVKQCVSPMAADRGNPLIGDQTGGANRMASTHKSWWECDTGIAYVVGSRGTDQAAGWRTGHHVMVYDLKNPTQPQFIRDWTLDGQQPGGSYLPHFDVAPAIHGPISIGPNGVGGGTSNRIYMPYGVGDHGVVQVVDRNKLISNRCGQTCTDWTTPEVGRWLMNPDNGGHTSFPLGKMLISDFVTDTGNDKGTLRDIVVVTSEATGNFCNEVRHMTYFVDVTQEDLPQGISTFLVPAESGPNGNFCDTAGRFGPHATNEEFGPPFYQKIIFVSYFAGGVRAIDVRDPYNPTEVAFFIPAITANTDLRCGAYQTKRCLDTQSHSDCVCKQVIQTNNVATDDRGYIYIVDRANTGMHILQLTGDAAAIAGLPH